MTSGSLESGVPVWRSKICKLMYWGKIAEVECNELSWQLEVATWQLYTCKRCIDMDRSTRQPMRASLFRLFFFFNLLLQVGG